MEVELGQYLGLRQELEQEEKKFQKFQVEKYNQRLQREKSITKGAKLKALRAKKYSVAHFTHSCTKSFVHQVNIDDEHIYKPAKLLRHLYLTL